MASFSFTLDDYAGLEQQIEAMFAEALEEAKPSLRGATKSALSAATSSDLPSKTIAYGKGKYHNGACYAIAYPSHGAKVNGTDAGTAAFYLEYGTGAKGRNSKGQPARPWVDKANALAEANATKAVEAVVDKFQKEYAL